MTLPSTSTRCDGPKSIAEAGQEFYAQLLKHFENDRPDVREQEAAEL